VWITVTADGGSIRRIRTPLRTPRVEAGRDLDPGEARAVARTLEELGVWSLGPCTHFSYDGWVCAVAVTDGVRLHSIQTHNPDGAHHRLIAYVLSLADVSEPPGGRTWALTTPYGQVVFGAPPSAEDRPEAPRADR
jgi:hypothetical protein